MSEDKQTKKVSKQRQEYLKFKPFADDLRKAESWCDLDGVLNRYQTVKNLSKMGYRKSQEVAREIFAEIEDRLGIGHDILDAWDILAKLKKKYTEEGK